MEFAEKTLCQDVPHMTLLMITVPPVLLMNTTKMRITTAKDSVSEIVPLSRQPAMHVSLAPTTTTYQGELVFLMTYQDALVF
jgi:hypothetical protein